jgi:glycine cleavage system H protein
LSLGPTGQAQVGVDDFALQVIGRIDAVELPLVGEQIRRGQRLFSVKQGSRTAEFSSPVDGVVSAVNQALAQTPEIMKSSPFQEGWACVLNPLNLAKDLKQLTIAEEAKDWLNREVQRFLAFVVSRPSQHLALGHVLQDGGEPASGLLEMMDDESWGQFTQRFLRETERV